ncbi:MAG: ABC transporter ATP-binding protein [Clostridia bacterium]|nr:ABC transporter ATP-binding protein [Oscillospiraceae bacterium]MBR6747411.1 ABC transporter ATP-binding protein [Clostridia bacterium]
MSKELIRLKDIVMTIGDNEVLKKMNLYIRDREFLTMLGPSGCGKTTTLRIIGGFATPTAGQLLFEDRDITKVPPHKRPINTVFQKYALFTHLNVYENVAFGLRLKKVQENEVKKRVGEMLEMVNLGNYGERTVSSLSGGEQQRVAIARALVNHPRILLLDEPLGALDLKLRKEMQLELKKIQQHLGITFIYVTHDQEEALTMSDTVVVMNKGRIQQIGTPIDIYNEPKNAFVADFIGESNIIPAVMEKDYYVRFADRGFECLDAGFAPNEDVEVVVRPEDIKVVDEQKGQLRGVVESTIFKGVHYEMVIRANGFAWLVQSTKAEEVGQEVSLLITPNDIHVMRKGVAEHE